MAKKKDKLSRSGKEVQRRLTEEEIKREISRVAQELYEKRGSIPGRELDDWLEAEKIVNAKMRS